MASSSSENVASLSWREIFLNHQHAAAARSVAESVAAGHSLLVLDAVATAAECERLASEATAAAAAEREAKGLAGLVRKPAVELIGVEGIALFDKLLLRQIDCTAAAAPTLPSSLFGTVLDESPSTCFQNPRLIWSEGEPAINVYTPGGCFTPHEDAQSITCLLNVSRREAYTGGGTAFWSLADAGFKRTLAETNPPSCLITPPAGTAIIFGGQVTHAAQPLLSGERIVCVASFSPSDFRGIIRPPADLQLFQAGIGGGIGEGDGSSLRKPACSHPPEDCSLEDMCAALGAESQDMELQPDIAITSPRHELAASDQQPPPVRNVIDLSALGALDACGGERGSGGGGSEGFGGSSGGSVHGDEICEGSNGSGGVGSDTSDVGSYGGGALGDSASRGHLSCSDGGVRSSLNGDSIETL